MTVTSWYASYGSAQGSAGAIAVSPVSPYNVYTLTGSFSTPYVAEYSASGSPITQWGGGGSGFGKFYNPQSIAVGPNGNVYVSDIWNHLVQEFDSNGNFLSQWTVTVPEGIAVAANGDVYVVDQSDLTIKVFGP